MVDMGVTQHHRVDAGGVEGERLGIARLVAATALYETAVEQHAPAADGQQVAGAGHFTGRAQKFHVHE